MLSEKLGVYVGGFDEVVAEADVVFNVVGNTEEEVFVVAAGVFVMSEVVIKVAVFGVVDVVVVVVVDAVIGVAVVEEVEVVRVFVAVVVVVVVVVDVAVVGGIVDVNNFVVKTVDGGEEVLVK